MSTNCLVTKLKGSVDNPNLDYLGVLKIKCVPVKEGETPSEASRVMRIDGANAARIINNVDNCYFTSRSGVENYGTYVEEGMPAFEHSDDATYVRVSNGNCDVLVFSKYNISYLIANGSSTSITKYIYADSIDYFGVNVDSDINVNIYNVEGKYKFSSLENSKWPIYSFTGIDVDIKNIKYPESIKEISFYESNIVDDTKLQDCLNLNIITYSVFGGTSSLNVSNLGKMTKLTSVLFTSQNIDDAHFGSIEDFVRTQRLYGRTTMTNFLWQYPYYCGLTFEGVRVAQTTEQSNGYISWTENQITWTYMGETKTINA